LLFSWHDEESYWFSDPLDEKFLLLILNANVYLLRGDKFV